MKSMSDLAHQFLKPAIHAQAVCIDATLGRGRDSRFFLENNAGTVFAYEIQPELAELCRKQIDSPKFSVRLKRHEQMAEDFQEGEYVDAVVFNFGYDPHTLSGVHTHCRTSLAAVMAATDLLRARGRMALVFYPHEEGRKEREAITEALLQRTDIDLLESARIDKPESPVLLCVEKRRASL